MNSNAMGLYDRKSVNLGPFRVNPIKLGFGYSVGGHGFRVGINTGGQSSRLFSANLHCAAVIGEVFEKFEDEKK